MLFRFLEYNYLNDDKYTNAKFITGITMEKNYDTFYKMLCKHTGKDILLKHDEWYTIDEIVFAYGGEEEDLFCVNVFCIGF